MIRKTVDDRRNAAKAVTGFDPGDGCMWRALLDPIVIATEARWRLRELSGALYMNEDMPGVLFDAAQAYYTYRGNARAHYREIERANRKAKSEANKSHPVPSPRRR